jgi:hypothetical protein
MFGGRDSLVTSLRNYPNAKIRSNLRVGLSVVAQTGITMSFGTRLFEGFKFINHPQSFEERLSELKRSTLTMVCIYSADTLDQQEPEGDVQLKQMEDEITFTQLGVLLNQQFFG